MSLGTNCAKQPKEWGTAPVETVLNSAKIALLKWLNALPQSSILTTHWAALRSPTSSPSSFCQGQEEGDVFPQRLQGSGLLWQVHFHVYWAHALGWKWAMPLEVWSNNLIMPIVVMFVMLGEWSRDIPMGAELVWQGLLGTLGEDVNFFHHRRVLFPI